MTKARILTESPRDYIRMTKNADGVTLTNERTGKAVTVPLGASAWQRREAIKQLQDAVDDPFAGMTAGQAVDQLAGAKPAERADDPEPYVPFSAGRLRNKALREHAEWTARQDAKAAREAAIRDRHALAAEIVEGLSAKPEQPPTVDLGDEYRRRMETTLALSKVRRDSNSTPEQIEAAEAANREAWGITLEAATDAR